MQPHRNIFNRFKSGDQADKATVPFLAKHLASQLRVKKIRCRSAETRKRAFVLWPHVARDISSKYRGNSFSKKISLNREQLSVPRQHAIPVTLLPNSYSTPQVNKLALEYGIMLPAVDFRVPKNANSLCLLYHSG